MQIKYIVVYLYRCLTATGIKTLLIMEKSILVYILTKDGQRVGTVTFYDDTYFICASTSTIEGFTTMGDKNLYGVIIPELNKLGITYKRPTYEELWK